MASQLERANLIVATRRDTLPRGPDAFQVGSTQVLRYISDQPLAGPRPFAKLCLSKSWQGRLPVGKPIRAFDDVVAQALHLVSCDIHEWTGTDNCHPVLDARTARRRLLFQSAEMRGEREMVDVARGEHDRGC